MRLQTLLYNLKEARPSRSFDSYIDELVRTFPYIDVDGTGDEFRNTVYAAYSEDAEDLEEPEDIPEDWLYEYFRQASSDEHIHKLFNSSFVDLYRALYLDSPEQLNVRKVGVYWSYHPLYAEVYGATEGDRFFVLHARASADDVNWVDTLYLNISAHNEAEIRLHENVPVEIVALYERAFLGGKQQLIDATPPELKGKIGRS